MHSAQDEAIAHRARIAAKRLRYLLEPVKEIVPGVPALTARLGEIQDQLGALHDAHVFAPELVAATSHAVGDHARRESLAIVAGGTAGRAARRVHARDPRPGLIALSERVRARGDGAFGAVKEHWLEGRAADFFAEVERVAASIEAHGLPTVEIERKYLLDRFPAAAADAASEEIEQGYVPGVRLHERLRRITAADGVRWYRTVKSGTGLVRTEIEEETTRDVFEAMWPLTEGRRVHKQRHRVQDGDLTWEIDHFLDRELTLAEVELPSEASRPCRPIGCSRTWCETSPSTRPTRTSISRAESRRRHHGSHAAGPALQPTVHSRVSPGSSHAALFQLPSASVSASGPPELGPMAKWRGGFSFREGDHPCRLIQSATLGDCLSNVTVSRIPASTTDARPDGASTNKRVA